MHCGLEELTVDLSCYFANTTPGKRRFLAPHMHIQDLATPVSSLLYIHTRQRRCCKCKKDRQYPIPVHARLEFPDPKARSHLPKRSRPTQEALNHARGTKSRVQRHLIWLLVASALYRCAANMETRPPPPGSSKISRSEPSAVSSFLRSLQIRLE